MYDYHFTVEGKDIGQDLSAGATGHGGGEALVGVGELEAIGDVGSGRGASARLSVALAADVLSIDALAVAELEDTALVVDAGRFWGFG